MPSPTELVASYRLQLTPDFGFDQACVVMDYLATIGISHVYLSPVAEAVPGSTHGYDVVDHRRVREELGGEAGLVQLLDVAAGLGLGVVIDHVPNHCSVARAELNPHWWALLRDGPTSPAAAWFDVDWDLTDGKVIVPKLGEPLTEVLAAGAIATGTGELGPELTYGPLRFPLASGTEHLEPAEAVHRQHYLLQHWRDPARNVRRFFTIDDLAAVRVEDADVADVVDSIPARLTDHPSFAGVRVDHVDGLADPGGYLRALRDQIGDRWLVVEKILAPGEVLPRSWPVDGTTGYEQITVAEHTMLDPAAEAPLTRLWSDLTGDPRPFAAVDVQARREVMDGGLGPDVDRLVRRIGAADPVPQRTRTAVVELTLALEQYRTYLPEDRPSAEVLGEAIGRAVQSRPEAAADIERIGEVIRDDPAVCAAWQQLTGPVMAKGAEDRAFYRYLRMASMCEVGGAPGVFTLDAEVFHRHQGRVQAGWPVTMLACNTHDTKRSDGVRARSLALAERAASWVEVVRGWFDANGDEFAAAGLDPAIMLLALQTAVSAAPISAQRLGDYLLKSAREADLHTAWTEPDDRYESALASLAEFVVADTGDRLMPFASELMRPGWRNALTEITLQLTCPGVPDLYQGSLVDLLTLVDPDNRLTPDWARLRTILDEAAGLDVATAWIDRPRVARGVVIGRVLGLRRRRPEAFGRAATYAPLPAGGVGAHHVVAYARGDAAGSQVVVVVELRSVSDDTRNATTVDLPTGRWRPLLVDDAPIVDGGAPVSLGVLAAGSPVVVLEREGSSSHPS